MLARVFPLFFAYLLLAAFFACKSENSDQDEAVAEAPSLDFVGRAKCVECHELEGQLYEGSHHDMAMDPPNEETVLGDFDDATHEHFGVTTTFRRDGERYLIETDGPDGSMQTYEVAYVFGVEPLQQYLVEFPSGKMQCLTVAWDSRPKSEGGQRWYHLHEDDPVPAGDELHWTGRHQTWNSMCARCHSTGLERRYDPQTRRFDTQWEEIDVSCEACHGPGSHHVEWAQSGKEFPGTNMGLPISLKDPAAGKWEIDMETGNAVRTAPRESYAEMETCARCHSRRQTLRESPVDGSSFHDQYLLAVLQPGLYHADGQILDEVYVYGSFLQSKMHQKGVTCTDCHEPHTAELLFEGNALCARCHLPAKYDTFEHKRHGEGPGSQCVDCHMPETHYMVVDGRRDHSIRVPRPDLSVSLGTPNACNQCHTDQDAQWAADLVAEWFPGGRHTTPHYAQAFAAAAMGRLDAEQQLAAVALDPEQPGIVRASAITGLRGASTPQAAQAILTGLEDSDPLVRHAAVSVFDTQSESFEARQPVVPRLEDPILSVRAEAVRVLSAVEDMPADVSKIFSAAVSDYVDSQMASADRPETHLNLGVFRMNRGRLIEAERSFREALEIAPNFLPAIVNLADILRARKKDDEAEKVLAAGIALYPTSPDLLGAMGLLLARTERDEEALDFLGRAAAAAPNHPRHVYIYAVALNSLGKAGEAITVLESAYQRHPANQEILQALATFLRDAGDPHRALPYARILLSLSPEIPGYQSLVSDLEAAAKDQ